MVAGNGFHGGGFGGGGFRGGGLRGGGGFPRRIRGRWRIPRRRRRRLPRWWWWIRRWRGTPLTTFLACDTCPGPATAESGLFLLLVMRFPA